MINFSHANSRSWFSDGFDRMGFSISDDEEDIAFAYSADAASVSNFAPQTYPFFSELVNISECPFVTQFSEELWSKLLGQENSLIFQDDNGRLFLIYRTLKTGQVKKIHLLIPIAYRKEKLDVENIICTAEMGLALIRFDKIFSNSLFAKSNENITLAFVPSVEICKRRIKEGKFEALIHQMLRCRLPELFKLIPLDLTPQESRQFFVSIIEKPCGQDSNGTSLKPHYIIEDCIERLYSAIDFVPATSLEAFLIYAVLMNRASWIEKYYEPHLVAGGSLLNSALNNFSLEAATTLLLKGCDSNADPNFPSIIVFVDKLKFLSSTKQTEDLFAALIKSKVSFAPLRNYHVKGIFPAHYTIFLGLLKNSSKLRNELLRDILEKVSKKSRDYERLLKDLSICSEEELSQLKSPSTSAYTQAHVYVRECLPLALKGEHEIPQLFLETVRNYSFSTPPVDQEVFSQWIHQNEFSIHSSSFRKELRLIRNTHAFSLRSALSFFMFKAHEQKWKTALAIIQIFPGLRENLSKYPQMIAFLLVNTFPVEFQAFGKRLIQSFASTDLLFYFLSNTMQLNDFHDQILDYFNEFLRVGVNVQSLQGFDISFPEWLSIVENSKISRRLSLLIEKSQELRTSKLEIWRLSQTSDQAIEVYVETAFPLFYSGKGRVSISYIKQAASLLENSSNTALRELFHSFDVRDNLFTHSVKEYVLINNPSTRDLSVAKWSKFASLNRSSNSVTLPELIERAFAAAACNEVACLRDCFAVPGINKFFFENHKKIDILWISLINHSYNTAAYLLSLKWKLPNGYNSYLQCFLEIIRDRKIPILNVSQSLKTVRLLAEAGFDSTKKIFVAGSTFNLIEWLFLRPLKHPDAQRASLCFEAAKILCAYGTPSLWARPFLRQIILLHKDNELFDILKAENIVSEEERSDVFKSFATPLSYKIRSFIQFIEFTLPTYQEFNISLEFIEPVWELLQSKPSSKDTKMIELHQNLAVALSNNPHFKNEYEYYIALNNQKSKLGKTRQFNSLSRCQKNIHAVFLAVLQDDVIELNKYLVSHVRLKKAFMKFQYEKESNLLFQAVEHRSYRVVDYLVFNGWNINQQIEFTTPFQAVLGLYIKGKENNPQLLEFCLSGAADPNQKIKHGASSEFDVSVLEFFYFKKSSLDKTLKNHLLDLMLKSRGRLTPRIIEDLRLQVKKKDSQAVEWLQNYGGHSSIELQALMMPMVVSGSREELLQLLEAAAYQLTKVNRIHNLSYEEVSLVDIQKFRQLKKRAKLYGIGSLQPIYSKMVTQYDLFVQKHIFLNLLQDISTEIRHGKVTSPSNRLIRFYSLFGSCQRFTPKLSEERIRLLAEENMLKTEWYEMYGRACAAALNAKGLTFSITWIHSTRNTSLPCIVKLNALVASQHLLEMKVPTFSGELSNSHLSINKEHISGESLSFHWDEETQHFDASTRSVASYMYAVKTEGYERKMQFNIKDTLERLTPQSIKDKLYATSLKSFTWELFYVEILRLRSLKKDADIYLKPFKEEIEKQLLEKCHSDETKNELTILLQALQSKIGVEFNEEELKIILSETSYPIIFASTNSLGELVNNEFIATSPQLLGENIQLAFVEKENLEEAKALLAPAKVQVFERDVLSYLELMNMTKGDLYIRTMKSSLSDVDKVSTILQMDVFPHYARPFREKSKIALAHPNYHSSGVDFSKYNDLFLSGQILAREVHGPSHAGRVTLYAMGLRVLRSRYLGEVSIPLLEVIYPVSLHDEEREDEAQDFWNEESGNFTGGLMFARGFSEKVAKESRYALANKDGKCVTALQAIVHDADCLDIVRVLKNPELEFIPSYLNIWDKEAIPSEIKVALIKEVREFVAETEDPEVKRAIESSSAVFKELFYRLASPKYPLFQELLSSYV